MNWTEVKKAIDDQLEKEGIPQTATIYCIDIYMPGGRATVNIANYNERDDGLDISMEW